jgi:threonine synthase
VKGVIWAEISARCDHPFNNLMAATARTLYCSTRGGIKNATFEDVVLGGLAPDRGLYVPEVLPTLTPVELQAMRCLTFPDLAYAIVSRFVGEEDIPAKDLKDIVDRSYSTFRSPDVSPVKQLGSAWILELFHGPTFAFKDVALQLLGNLFEYFLSKRSGAEAFLTILGATSGDTGSAAIYGLRGKANVRCFILYPKGRTSAIQERQMTTVPDKNVQCIAVEGTFDDCQNIVKAAFQDASFREEIRLGAVNSINWARVLAQITYYFWAYFRITDFDPSIEQVKI